MKNPIPVAMLAAGLVLALSTASRAQAPIVTFHMDLTIPGEFSLFASASAGDNFGITCYGLPFDVATTARITSLEHLSPVSQLVEDLSGISGSAGFNVLRSALVFPDRGLTVFAGQNTILRTPHLIRGLGQSAGSLSELGLTPLCPPVQPEWGQPLLLARGTYTGDSSDFRLDTNSVDLVANVFASETGRDVLPAEIRLTDSNGFEWMRPPVPEPVLESPPAFHPPATPPTVPEPPIAPILAPQPDPPANTPPATEPVAVIDPPFHPGFMPVPIDIPPGGSETVTYPYWPAPFETRPLVVLDPEELQKLLIDPIIDVAWEPKLGFTPESNLLTTGWMIDYVDSPRFHLAGLYSDISTLSFSSINSGLAGPEGASLLAAVPEPASFFLAVLAACAVLGFQRHQDRGHPALNR